MASLFVPPAVVREYSAWPLSGHPDNGCALERHLPRSRAEYEQMLDELNDALEHALEDLRGAAAGPETKAV